MEALDFLEELITSAFIWVVETLFKPIVQVIKEWVRGLGEIIRNSFDCHSPIETVGGVAGTVKKLWSFMFIPVQVIAIVLLSLVHLKVSSRPLRWVPVR